MSNVYENTIAVSVGIHRFGVSRGVSEQHVKQVMNGVDERVIEQYLRTTRKLIVCKEYDAVVSCDTGYQMWLRKISVPSYFRRGIYLVPVGSIERDNERFSEYMCARDAAIIDLGVVWHEKWNEAQSLAGGDFGYVPCPLWSEVKKRFYVERKFIDLGVPGKLKCMSYEMWENEQQAMRERLQMLERDLTALLRGEVYTLTSHLVNRLKGLDDGTTKAFHESNFTKLREWCQEFLGGRNVVNDEELKGQVLALGDLLDGNVSVRDIKSDEILRASVIGNFGEIEKELGALCEAVPEREVVIDE